MSAGLGLLAAGLGQAVETGFNIYDRTQQRKLDRRSLALQEEAQRWKRLMDLTQQGQQLPVQASAIQRMIALRNAGG